MFVNWPDTMTFHSLPLPCRWEGEGFHATWRRIFSKTRIRVTFPYAYPTFSESHFTYCSYFPHHACGMALATWKWEMGCEMWGLQMHMSPNGGRRSSLDTEAEETNFHQTWSMKIKSTSEHTTFHRVFGKWDTGAMWGFSCFLRLLLSLTYAHPLTLL